MINIRSVIVACALAATVVGCSRPADRPTAPARHRVVVEVSVDGADRWEAVLNNVENLQKAFGNPKAEIEVVAHGKGIGILLSTNVAMTDRMSRIAGTGLVFAACENTMHKQQLAKTDLMPFVITVDSGVAEVVRKQEAGWSYLKGGE
jgi:intracellular sulfur oxidation DsrE/DsrF family protein